MVFLKTHLCCLTSTGLWLCFLVLRLLQVLLNLHNKISCYCKQEQRRFRNSLSLMTSTASGCWAWLKMRSSNSDLVTTWIFCSFFALKNRSTSLTSYQDNLTTTRNFVLSLVLIETNTWDHKQFTWLQLQAIVILLSYCSRSMGLTPAKKLKASSLLFTAQLRGTKECFAFLFLQESTKSMWKHPTQKASLRCTLQQSTCLFKTFRPFWSLELIQMHRTLTAILVCIFALNKWLRLEFLWKSIRNKIKMRLRWLKKALKYWKIFRKNSCFQDVIETFEMTMDWLPGISLRKTILTSMRMNLKRESTS